MTPPLESKAASWRLRIAAPSPGARRYRRAGLSASAALIARGLSVGLALLTVPLTLGYLGTERYGMWVTISSMIALLAFADLGIGYGLLNVVTQATAAGRIDEARREVSSAIVLLVVVAAALALVFMAATQFVSWAHVLAVSSSTAVSEAAPGVTAWFACFLVALPLSVVTQVRMARQEAYVTNLMTAVGNVASVAALLLVIRFQLGLPALVLAMAGPPLLTTAVNGVLLFVHDAPELRPAPSLADRGTEMSLLRRGSLFLVLQLAIAVAFTSDTLVVARILGPAAAAEYGVTTRMFLIPAGIIGIVLTPLWPAYGDALARGDVGWARRTLRLSLWMGLGIGVPAGIVLVAFGVPLIHAWTGPSVTPSLLLLSACGIWLVQNTVGNAIAMLLNGAGEIRWQAVAGAVMAVANIALSIWLTFRIGVAGVMWGTVITYTLFVLVPMAAYFPRVLAAIERRASCLVSQ